METMRWITIACDADDCAFYGPQFRMFKLEDAIVCFETMRKKGSEWIETTLQN